MENEIEKAKGISAYDALLEAKTHLDVALTDYGLRVGEPLHLIDYEHVKQAQAIVQLLVVANRG
jgi:hypothetical protein